MPAEILPAFFRKNFLAAQNSSILKINKKILKKEKGAFVDEGYERFRNIKRKRTG